MTISKNWLRTALCALILLLCLQSAFADSTVVVTATTKAYKSASTSSASIKVKKGMELNLIAVKGKWALVESDGVYAYMKVGKLTLKEEEPDYSDLLANAQTAVITSNTRVYKSASTSSASMKVKKGLEVNLLATSGKWALVENGGVYAYMKVSELTLKQDEPDYSDLLANAKAAVITANAKVYKSANTSSASTWVKKDTEVNLLAINGSWALIERDGVYAFISADAVTAEAEATPTPDYSSLMKDAKAAVMAADAMVYQSADTSSASAMVSKGTKVNLLAVNGSWALIEKSGAYGFVNADAVTLEATATPTPSPTPSSGYLDSDKYTNEQKCYLFLTNEGGLNAAAACGILANIRKESNFNPASGSSYYGLIQWGGGRLTNLKSYCSTNGYSVSSLEGQLRFLMYELKNSYPSVLTYLQSVSNTADGAYDAAYYFCYYYERPANKASSSASRGELARDTYYPRYAV